MRVPILLSFAFFLGLAVMVGVSQEPDEKTLRSQAAKNFADSNFQDAINGYKQLLKLPQKDPKQVASDFDQAFAAISHLGLTEDFDALAEEVLQAHGTNHRLLLSIGEKFERVPHYGIISDQTYTRNPTRNRTGQWSESTGQDRNRALALTVKAIELALQEEGDARLSNAELALYYQQLARQLLWTRTERSAWLLQQATDLNEKIDYLDTSFSQNGTSRFAPVDSQGNPVLYSIPASWNDAKNDGERFRWAMAQAIELDRQIGIQVEYSWANLLNGQFSVDTLQQDLWFFRNRNEDDNKDNASSISAIHTLKDNEAIARLANGIKRFELTDEFNPIAIYKRIAEQKDSELGEQALNQLWNIFQNRRQYPRAVEYIRQSIATYGDSQQWKKTQLDNIIEPRGSFDPVPSQLEGTGATLSMLFRNATTASFSASPIDFELYFADTKKFFKDNNNMENPAFGGLKGYSYSSIQYPTMFSEKDFARYVKPEVANWSIDLEPRANHWDRRIDISTPLQKAGWYVVTAKLNGDAYAFRCLVWVNDTVVIQKPSNEDKIFFVNDATTGAPLPNITVEYFGYGVEYIEATGRNRYITKNFAKKTNAVGQIVLTQAELPNNYQWMTVARGTDRSPAILDASGAWFPYYGVQQFSQLKAYGVSERPIYKPGESIQAKFWVALTSYGAEAASQFPAGTPCKASLIDPQGKPVWEGTFKTDKFGGGEVKVDLSKNAMLGVYRFQFEANGAWIATNLAVRVEEYRKPEFEVKITAPDKPIALGEKFEAKIDAKYYFGSPVSDAQAVVRVERTAYADQYYPVAPFDWCYGPGYWWYAYDYDWYPGWSSWVGCRAPYPWWIPNFGSDPPELVLEQELKLDAQGKATIAIDTALVKEIQGDQDHRYSISVEVRDASRRVITASGEVIAARQPFKIYSWTDRGFYRVKDAITTTFQARTLAGTSVEGKGKISLYGISYKADGQPEETLVQQWDVTTDAEGKVAQKFVADKSGQYRIALKLTDAANHEVEGAYLFTVRGTGDRGRDYRYSALELITDKQHYVPGEKVRLQINADKDDAWVALFVRPSGGAYSVPQWFQLKNKTQTVEISVKQEDQPNFFVEAFTVYNGEVHSATREVIVPPESKMLNVSLKSSKEEYLPGEEAEVEVVVTDPQGKPVSGSTVLAVYDRSLEALAGDVLPPDIREFFWKWRRQHSPVTMDNVSWQTSPIAINIYSPMQSIGLFGATLADDFDNLDQNKAASDRKPGMASFSKNMRSRMAGGMPGGGGGMGGFGGGYGGVAESAAPMAMMADKAMPTSAMAGLGAGEGNGGGAAPAGQAPAAVRKDFADAALWLANITTDASGKATARFKMPENLTSWKIRSWAVGSETRVGSAAIEAVTRKNLLVRLQIPRFLVERDEVVFSSLINNDLPEAKQVRVSLEIDGQTQLELLSGSEPTQMVTVPSKGQVRVDWRCKALAEGEVTVRTIATSDVESDAMQLKLPILVHGILKTDSFAGTVRQDKNSSTTTIKIPEDRRVEQSRLTVRLSPSLAASMIDALPYLVDYPHGCTEQTLNRFLPTVITQRVLQEMQVDLKRLAKRKTNLNAQELGDAQQRAERWKRFERNPVYDEAEVKNMVDDGINRLTNQQNSDGGWGWFSGNGEQSWPHTTAVVVRGLTIAQQNDVAIVPNVLERGYIWLEQYQNAQLVELKAFRADNRTGRAKPNDTDALVFHVLVSAGRFNPEMQQILYDDRDNLSAYGKVLLALATHKVGNQEQTDMLRRNLEQFLVEDAENETAYLRDEASWWYWYGSSIERNAMYLKLLAQVDAKGVTAPRVVKYLLNNRKHATYWDSTRDTALVVEAFADYLKASGETKANVTAEVWLSGKRLGSVEFTPDNLFDVDNTIEIGGNAVPAGEHQLEIRRSGEGPIYWNAYSSNFTLEEEMAASGLEVKVERRFYRIEREQKDLTLSGDRGQIIEGKRSSQTRITIEELKDLPSGTIVEVELIVESKNDYEYLLLEDRKPAGLEAIDTQSGYDYNNGLGVYREFREQKTNFYLRVLPRGTHSLKYQLRAEAPGKFTALPAQVSGMYAPELSGSSPDFDLIIVD